LTRINDTLRRPAWNSIGHRLTLVTKELGDYRRRLPETLHIGRPVRVEGPYGCFTFDENRPRRIWIGGGIGITPFIARMKELAPCSDKPFPPRRAPR
jgi:predicted ferric reductase